jgi:DNA-binding transcriptional regulator YhcF (GntR family)
MPEVTEKERRAGKLALIKPVITSVDGGKQWARFTGNFPKVSVRDMTIQERENDLVVATHGRGILILDDITPLRYLTPELLAKEMAFLPSRPYLLHNQGYAQEFPGDGEFAGPNPPEAALLTYYLKKRHIFGDMHIEVYGPDGKKIRDLAAGKRKGINRVQMPIRMKPPRVPTSKTLSFAGFFGPLMKPGTYTVKIIKKDQLLQGAFEIRDDPSLPYTDEDRALQRKTLMKAYHMLEDLAFLDRQVTGVMQQARERKKEGVSGSIQKKLDEVIREMQAIHVKLVETKAEGMFTSEEQLRQKIAAVYGGVVNYLGRPTNSQIERLKVLEKEMDSYRDQYEELFNTRVEKINLYLEKKGFKPIRPVTRKEFDQEKEK